MGAQSGEEVAVPHLHATITNRLTHFPNWWLAEGQANSVSGLDSFFSYRVPNWEHTIRAQNGWDGFQTLLEGEVVGTGLFLAKLEGLRQAGYTFTLDDRRKWVEFYRAEDCQLIGREPYQWHREAVEFMRENANCGGIIIGPTATGKTSLAGWAFARLTGMGVFVVNDAALGLQTRAELEAILGEPVGFVGSGKFSVERITVALVQTLDRHHADPRFAVLHGADLMLIDELHVMLHGQMWHTVQRYLPAACFGLTATLDLSVPAVALCAYAMCGPGVYRHTAETARARNEITQGWCYMLDVPTLVDASELHISQVYREHVVENDWLNRFAGELAVAAIKAGYTVVVLVQTHEHVDRMAEVLTNLGVEFLIYSGKQVGKARIAVRNALNQGAANLGLATTGTMTKGISIPRLNFLIDLSQSRKWENSVQRAGRGARNDTGKDHFVYVDIGQKAKVVRGMRKRNLFEVRAKDRRRGLRDVGYVMRSRALDSTNEAGHEAVAVLNHILQTE